MAVDLCDVNDFLVRESGRISKDMQRRLRTKGPWNNQIKQGEWPLEMGNQLTVINYERSNPTTTVAWTDVASNDGTGNVCNPTSYTINPASTARSYALAAMGLRSNPLCILDANSSVAFPRQLEAIVRNLEGNIYDIWADRKRDQYIYLAGHKIIAADGVPETGSAAAWSLTEPTSVLTVGLLDYVYDRFMRDGGGEHPGVPKTEGQPTPLVIISPEQKRGLFFRNAEVRQDFRFSAEATKLLNPLGIRGAYANFMYATDFQMPRYDFVGGAWVRRPYYTSEAATIGDKANVNPAYEDAGYEDVVIFHPAVYTLEMYNPTRAFGQGVSFANNNWAGTWKWINKYDKDCNEDENTGYFRSLLASAPRPDQVELGYVIRVKRCPNDYGFIECTSS